MSEYTREQRAADLNRRLRVYRNAYREMSFSEISARIQRNIAINYLLRILEGDREAAITDARGWLVRYFKSESNYQLMAKLTNEIVPAALAQVQADRDSEWPEELAT